MTSTRIEELKRFLQEERLALMHKAYRTLKEEATFDTNELPDELDQASAEYGHAVVFRLRDREKHYLTKIARALHRMETGEFGYCEDCGERISWKRIRARPVTTRCIQCKEKQEIRERSRGQ